MTTPTQVPQMQNPDALRRSVNAIFALLTASGPTTGRPTPSFVGQPYFDTTLGSPVWWNGAHWVDAAGAAV
jgi:hypothetical protein